MSAFPAPGSSAGASSPAYFRATIKIPKEILEPSLAESGHWKVRLEGYGALPRAGAPSVPIRIERIALPATGDPVLRILRSRMRPLPALRLETVPSPGNPRSDRGPDSDPEGPPVYPPRYRPDTALEKSDRSYPGDLATLGEVGYLRDQRYVELILTPLQVHPKSGTAQIAEEIELEIFLDGIGALGPSVSGRPDPRGKVLYRDAFLNPSQIDPESARPQPEAFDATQQAVSPEAITTTTAYRIGAKQEGIYRVSCASLPSCAVPDLIGVDPATFRLRNKGVEVPLRIIGGGDGSFDLGDILEFYGQPQADPFTTLNCGPPTCATPVYEAADFTDTNVYLLDSPGSAGRLRMTALDGTPGGLTAEANFQDTAHVEVNDRFLPLADQDPFYWLPTLTADEVTTAFRDLTVPLPGIAPVAFTAPARVRLRGVTTLDGVNPDHRTRVTINGAGATQVTLDWDGDTTVNQDTSASQSILTNPTTVKVEVVAVPGISVDQVLVDYAEITYRRQFQAASDVLAFNFANQAAKFLVQGYSASPVLAYDVSRILAGTSDTREPRLVINGAAGATSLTFQVAAEAPPTGSTRRFLVLGPGGYRTPDFVTVLPTNHLRETTNEADYLILAHPSLIDSTAGSAYSQFVDYLATVRGLTVKLVYIQDIYDAFSDSVANPEAIRSFLAYAHANWVGPSGTAPPPAYLLLVGDAVWDPKNNLNRSDWVDLVPTVIMLYDQSILKFYSADTWLASYLGADHSPDILHGRIPVRTQAQANAVFTKILAYTQSPPPGAWRADGYFLADVGNVVQETQLFESEEDIMASNFTPPWTQTKQYYAQPPYNAPVGGNGPVEQFKADFVSHWNSAHPAVASFSGHGAFDILGNDLFFRPADVPLLTNGAYQPFFYNSDCLSGGFHAVGVDSMAEAFLQSATGGSIGYFAPAGLSFTFFASTVSGQLFADLFGAEKLRELGTLTERARGALFQQGAIADMQGYAFVGEPALQLVLPAPQPPDSFSVSAGNSVVNLSWTPSPDPNSVGTNLYRTQNPAQPYVKLNGSPVTGTAFSDTTVSNGTTYFYRAVSVDAAGFEGAVTNTNADCGVSGPPDGPQCRRALPQNLTPPIAPQGVKVRDTGIGTVLEVSWLANPEPDIQRYVVAYGTVSGSHPLTRNAGLATTFSLTGLTAGTPYFVVVRAVNTSGIQGGDSNEVSETPHVFNGVAPPATIRDLMVNRSGDDLVLTWSRVTTNIYGNPTAVDHYNIYRGSTPTFVPSNSVNRIGQIPDAPNPSFTHSAGALAPGDGYYLVSAEDLFGNASGLGGDLPAGIVTLAVAPASTPGQLRLSWPAVTLTVTGQAAHISHYRLYGSTSPVPRSAINPTLLIQDNIFQTFVEIPTPADPRFYYNLIVVDDRGNLSPY
jgi:hypothetical protein